MPYTKLDTQMSVRIIVLTTAYIVLLQNGFKPFGLRCKNKLDPPRSWIIGSCYWSWCRKIESWIQNRI